MTSPAQRAAIYAFRNDPLNLTIVIEQDLTGADLSFAVRQYPDQGGSALLGPITGSNLAATLTVGGTTSVRLIEVDIDDDGVARSWIEIRDTKAHMQALPAPGEAGADLTLYYDVQWELSTAQAAPFAPDEQTYFFGDFIVRGGANG